MVAVQPFNSAHRDAKRETRDRLGAPCCAASRLFARGFGPGAWGRSTRFGARFPNFRSQSTDPNLDMIDPSAGKPSGFGVWRSYAKPPLVQSSAFVEKEA